MRELLVAIALAGCGRISFDPLAGAADAVTDVALRGCVAQVASNGDQTCVRRFDGHVWCWGDNSTGQLGNGTLSPSIALPAPSLMLDAIDLVAGEDTVCVIRADRSLSCWGEGTNGQVGDSGFGDRAAPVTVMQGPVVEVVAGQFHTCARLADGTGFCWGRNDFGQLGAAPSTDRGMPGVAPIGDAVQLAAGDNFTCTRLVDGAVRCFGLNDNGQLGDGTQTSRATVTPATLLPEPAIDITAGCHKHACAVGASGEVYCWGENVAEQIGVGMATPFVSTPAHVLGVSNARQVVVGVEHTCALTGTDEIWCWGTNTDGQLGNGGFATASAPTRVVRLTGSLQQLEAACSNTYAVRTDGTLIAWGAGTHLGNGALTSQPVPVDVPIPCD